ncbi:copper chaperone PCu(A)C [Fodinicurvata sp. EGI_FJ10296]|uniref:copper chaperone PCu(A)C n=1 Tax=Fodinicurvata sp. EGI_FJ10296 TaxID=3231908 RepID=UPI0034521654
MKKTFLAASLAAFMAAGVAIAHHGETPVEVGAMAVSHSWTQETSATAHSMSVFTTIDNHGEESDRLISAGTDFADAGVFRAPVLSEDGALQVVDVPAVEIAPGQTLTLEPGGVHIVLPDVQQAFLEGDHFHMDLEFEKAGSVRVAVDVDHGHDDDDARDHDRAS